MLGIKLTHDLLDKGFIVKVLIRNTKSYKGQKHINLKLIPGNLFEDFTSVIKDIDLVIHIAAETIQNLTSYKDYRNINYNATVQLFHAAIRCKVKKFIFISTVNTIGYGSLDAPGTEQNCIRPPFSHSYYAKSKMNAENYMLQNKYKIDVSIINPTFMLGAYDTKPSSGKITLMGWQKRIIFYPPGGKNFVHVKDVSGGIINCMEKGKSGERYIMANENLTYREFFKRLNKITNQRPIMIQVPKPLLLLLGYLGDTMRFFKIKSSLSSVNMNILCISNYYSNKKSISQLNIEYQSIDVAISDAVNYFKHTKP